MNEKTTRVAEAVLCALTNLKDANGLACPVHLPAVAINQLGPLVEKWLAALGYEVQEKK